MKRLYWIILTILLFIPSILYGQELKIKSFYLAETDLTANTPGTMEYDQNGNLCALIKVETVLDGFTFDVGTMGITEAKKQTAEYWVYVPFGIKKITVQHPKFGTVREYPIPCYIDKGRTYIMTFEATGRNIVYDSSKKQEMYLHLYPPTAKVEINGISLPVTDGICKQEFSFGMYDAIISAPDYHTDIRPIEVNDPDNPQHYYINLKQAYGWLNIKSEGDETLTLDEKPYDYVPGENLKLNSRHYQLQMTKPLHKPYTIDIEIKDSTVTEIVPQFEVNYKELEVRVRNNAEIYIDSVKVGNGSWKGKLEYGEHLFTCKLESHRDSEMTMEIHSETLGPIVLNTPEPIYGILDVSGSPTGAEVYVDDKLAGHVPCAVEVLIGTRNIRIEKTSFVPQSTAVIINEGETSPLIIQLTDVLPVTFKSNPKADLFIDGQKVGRTSYSTKLPSGEHHIKLSEKGYYDFEKTIQLTEAYKEYDYKLKKRYYYPSSFYFSGEYQTLNFNGVKGSMGFCIKNINFEANYVHSLTESETIYWNIPGKMSTPYGYTYKPTYAGAKLGFSFTMGPKIRVIPQVGAGVMMLEGTVSQKGTYDPKAEKACCIPFNASMRFDIAIASVMAITIRPDYYMPIYQCDLYSRLSNASSTIAAYASGLSASAGLCFFF